MPYAASHVRVSDPQQAVTHLCHAVRSQLEVRPDISFLFVTAPLTDQLEGLAEQVRRETGTRHLLGCTAECIAGGGEEIEEGPAISLFSAVLPGAEITPFWTEFEQTPDGVFCYGVPEELSGELHSIFVLGDPYSSAIDALLDRLGTEYPGVPVLGGMASAAQEAGQNRLVLNDRCVDTGAVGLCISGGPRVRSIVSQGCRPIGTPFIVTKSQQNIVLELGGKPPLIQLQEVYKNLSDRDRELVRKGLNLGIVLDEYRDEFGRGDFLISNVMGADQDSGAIAIASFPRRGQTVQFHVRDAATADEDLRQLLTAELGRQPTKPRGALLFSCNGRGTRLFDAPHHDAGAIQELCGTIPLAGFFAAGELGPIGGTNHVHGFTASVALFD